MNKLFYTPYIVNTYIKTILMFVLLFWAVTATVLLLRNKPQTILIGFDDVGARLITDDKDKLVLKEQLNFIKRYIFLMYTYTSETFDSQVTLAGDLMSDRLWSEKQSEFKVISEKIKSKPIDQVVNIEDIKAIDANHIETILKINITSRLETRSVRLKVNLQFSPKPRSRENPWAWEVDSYVENEITN